MRTAIRWVAGQAAATWCGVVGHAWHVGPVLTLVASQRVKQGPVVCTRCGKGGW